MHQNTVLSATRHMRVATALVLAVLLTACATPASYREPITRFQQASTVVIEVARIEYNDANVAERDAFIDKQAANRGPLSPKVLKNADLRVLEPEDLEARMLALNALAKHGQLLLALASSDAPQRAKDAANSLDEAVTGLSKSIGAAPSEDFKEKAGAFAAIVSKVTELVLAKKITEALDKSITASKSAIPGLTKLMREEFAALYERRKTRLSGERTRAFDAYTDAIAAKEPDAGTIAKTVAEIKRVEDEWDQLPLQRGASESIDAMEKAHKELVEYAESDKAPQDLADLAEAIDTFVASAKIIADSIRTIRKD